jgi:tRNA(fMet)-specific endonuclease VapC
MKTYLLDTNIVSHIIRGDIPAIRTALEAVPVHSVHLSVISEAELLYGLLRRGNPTRLAVPVEQFLRRVTILPWHRSAAQAFAELRTNMARRGLCLSTMDMLIAAHAKAAGAVLVSRDQSFAQLGPLLPLEDWSR